MSFRLLSRSLVAPRVTPFKRVYSIASVLSKIGLRTVISDATKSHTDASKIPDSGDEHFTVNLAPEAFETYNLDPLSLQMDVTKNELIKMYTDMVVIRRLEMASDALYKAKKIRGLYVFLEALTNL
jgi:pyruvate dehydrogenase E1 component alpha subunit